MILRQGPSEFDIRNRLTVEEEQDQIASAAIDSWTDDDEDFTEMKYLLYGLDLEGQQYVFRLLPCPR